MKKFDLLSQFKGYSNKADITNIDPGYLVPPSQNVIINDQEMIEVSAGYELVGPAGTSSKGTFSSYDWITSTNSERNVYFNDTKLYYRYVDSAGDTTWRDLGLTLAADSKINFAEWWSSAEALDHLLFVDGTSNIYMWSGGVATFASATVNTVTKQGTTTWAEERFLKAGTRSIMINGVPATYTGGEGTTTLTGVSVDFSATAVGSVIHQAVRTTAATPASASDNDIIETLNNYVYVADLNLRTVYVSKNTDYTNYGFTAPVRLPGEGALLTLDASPVAFVPQEEDMYISAQKDQWYKTQFTLSADLTGEDLRIKRLKSGPGQGALSQSSIGRIKNSVLYLTNDKAIDTIGRIENINTPTALPISDIVKREFQDYSYAIEPHIKYFKNKSYCLIPSESKMMIYDHEKQLWNPPRIAPFGRLAIIDGELCAHSLSTDETFALFTGTSDNGGPIDWKMWFAYRNYGRRDWEKEVNEWMTEGYISSNTSATQIVRYDYGGFTSIIENVIEGSMDAILFSPIADSSIGKVPLGSVPLGSAMEGASELSKFRVIFPVVSIGSYETQIGYEGNGIDDQFRLLASGGDIVLSDSDNVHIKVNN